MEPANAGVEKADAIDRLTLRLGVGLEGVGASGMNGHVTGEGVTYLLSDGHEVGRLSVYEVSIKETESPCTCRERTPSCAD